jgi:chorismate synthase
MLGNSFGELVRLTTFGESHGEAIGGVLDGFPSGFEIDFDWLNRQVARRKPGQSSISTQRNESDEVHFVSGVFEGKTLGTPIAFWVKNTNHQSKDYDDLKEIYRPGHADYTYEAKYGIRDHRGGGRSSARETVARVVAGNLCQQFLFQRGISISAYVNRVKNVSWEHEPDYFPISVIDQTAIRCPEIKQAQKMIRLIEKTAEVGDSVGGSIICVAKGVPPGLGEPVFSKLHAELAKAMMSINAVKSFEIGDGISGTYMNGSELNDEFTHEGGYVSTTSNHSGGIQGGISNGQLIWCTVGFKPVSSIKKLQNTVNRSGEAIQISVEGRHDPCVLPRAVPIVESMMALVLMNMFLKQLTNKQII